MKRLFIALLVSLVLLTACSAPATAPPPTSPVPSQQALPKTTPAPMPAPADEKSQQAPTPATTPTPPADEAKVHFEQGNIFYLDGYRGGWSPVIAEYTKAIELNPKFAEAYANRGAARLEQLKYDGGSGWFSNYNLAIADCEKAIELNPLVNLNISLAEAYVRRGDYYFEYARSDSDYYKAIADFTMAMKLDPLIKSRKPADVIWKLGEDYLDRREYDSFIAVYTKAIELDPGNTRYYYTKLAEAYYGRGYDHYRHSGFPFDEAIADYTRAIELDSTNAEYYLSRGYIYQTLAFSHYEWGRVAEGKNSTNKAIADYRKALELSKDASQKEQILKDIEELQAK